MNRAAQRIQLQCVCGIKKNANCLFVQNELLLKCRCCFSIVDIVDRFYFPCSVLFSFSTVCFVSFDFLLSCCRPLSAFAIHRYGLLIDMQAPPELVSIFSLNMQIFYFVFNLFFSTIHLFFFTFLFFFYIYHNSRMKNSFRSQSVHLVLFVS